MAVSSGRRASPARDRLLAAAQARFNEDGYNGAGIDAIIAEAGIARMTLYNHFPSKDALIEAVLERRHQDLTAWVMEGVNRRADDPALRLLAVFDVLADWLGSDGFRGCLLLEGATARALVDGDGRAEAGRAKRIATMLVGSG